MPPWRSSPSRRPFGARYFFHQVGTLSVNEGSMVIPEKITMNSNKALFHRKDLFILGLLGSSRSRTLSPAA